MPRSPDRWAHDYASDKRSPSLHNNVHCSHCCPPFAKRRDTIPTGSTFILICRSVQASAGQCRPGPETRRWATRTVALRAPLASQTLHSHLREHSPQPPARTASTPPQEPPGRIMSDDDRPRCRPLVVIVPPVRAPRSHVHSLSHKPCPERPSLPVAEVRPNRRSTEQTGVRGTIRSLALLRTDPKSNVTSLEGHPQKLTVGDLPPPQEPTRSTL